MIQKNEYLLLKDLCMRLPYKVYINDSGIPRKLVNICWDGIKFVVNSSPFGTGHGHMGIPLFNDNICYIKPYLRPMSSMTEEEARDVAILHGNNPEDILSIKITDEYIDIILDDGVCGTITETIWYNEIVSSVECLDWLNAHYFD